MTEPGERPAPGSTPIPSPACPQEPSPQVAGSVDGFGLSRRAIIGWTVAMLSVMAVPGCSRTALPRGALIELGNRPFRHRDEVNSVHFSPDGMLIATGGSDGRACIWDIASGRKVQEFRILPRSWVPGWTDTVTGVAFSPEGKWLAAASLHDVYIWPANGSGRTRRLQWTTCRGHSRPVFSPSGRWMATSRHLEVHVWDTTTWEKAYTINVPEGRGRMDPAVCFSRDEKILLHGHPDNAIHLYDLARRAEVGILDGHAEGVDSLSLSHDGRLLASGDGDGTVCIWDLAKRERLRTLKAHSKGRTYVEFEPEGTKLMTTGADDIGRIWDASSGKELRQLPDCRGVPAFSPGGREVASASHGVAPRLWNLESGAELFGGRGHSGDINCVASSPHDTLCATGSDDHSVRLWDTSTGRQVRDLSGHSERVLSVAFSPDGQLLASGAQDRTARLWDVANGREVGRIAPGPGRVTCVAFSPDGRLLGACGYDQSPSFWDVDSHRKVADIRAPATRLAFSTDGRTVALGHRDYVHLFDLPARKALHRVYHPSHSPFESLQFSPDGRVLIVGSLYYIALYEAATARKLREIRLPYRENVGISAMGLSPDGSLLAFGTQDIPSRLCLVELSTGKFLAKLKSTQRYITEVAFSRDGTRLVTASWGAKGLVWDVSGYAKRARKWSQVTSLADPGCRRNVQVLIPELTDANFVTRWNAREDLAWCGLEAKQGLPALKTILNGRAEREPELCRALVTIGANYPDEVLFVLAEALASDNEEGRRIAHVVWDSLRPVIEIDRPGRTAVPLLVKALRSRTQDVRMRATWALGTLGTVSGDALPALAELLRDDSESVRQAAAKALEKIKAAQEKDKQGR